MAEEQKTLVSGIKPTGTLHVGNYFGAIKQLVELHEGHRSFIFIANYHALTTTPEPEELRALSFDIAIDYIAAGLNPEKTILFLQSDVPELTELAWVFECLTTVPYLERGHAYKDAVAKGKEAGAGILNYPMLMAADILMQDADIVPVGRDQKQHIEFTRDTAEKFNKMYGDIFKIPEARILEETMTVPGTDGRKMSKSYGNTIPLFGSDEEIKRAVMSIVTDSKKPEEPKDPGEDNVFALHKLFSGEQLGDLEKRYRDGGIGYQESKELLADNIIKFIAPMREKRAELEQNKDHVRKILENGGEIARSAAQAKMMEVRKKVGLS